MRVDTETIHLLMINPVRHKKDLDTGDPTRAGYLSYYILWNKKTLAGSIKHFKNKFKLN